MKRNRCNDGRWRGVLGFCFLCFIILIVLVIVFLMKGGVTTSGEFPEDVSYESLTCEIEGMAYPFFEYDNSIKNYTRISFIFGVNGISSVSLVNELFYDDAGSITASEAFNHAAMNKSFMGAGYGADALNIKYSKMEDKLKTSIYASGSEITNDVLEYFMLEGMGRDEDIVEVDKYLTSEGFSCSPRN